MEVSDAKAAVKAISGMDKATKQRAGAEHAGGQTVPHSAVNWD